MKNKNVLRTKEKKQKGKTFVFAFAKQSRAFRFQKGRKEERLKNFPFLLIPNTLSTEYSKIEEMKKNEIFFQFPKPFKKKSLEERKINVE